MAASAVFCCSGFGGLRGLSIPDCFAVRAAALLRRLPVPVTAQSDSRFARIAPAICTAS